MILREGVNSPLMKFAEDIKLEGVVNTNEDSKAVQRDLAGEEPWQETAMWWGWDGVGWMCGLGSTWGHPESQGRGKGIPSTGVELGAAAASRGAGHGSKPQSWFSHL